MTPSTPLTELRAAVQAASDALAGEHSSVRRPAPTLERPKKAGFGDYATNAAMLLAPVLKAPPRDVAGRLGEELGTRLGERLERVEVAGPGFLNLFLGDAWFRDGLAGVLADPGWGGGGVTTAESIDVEFVSANPTGPMHVGHARNAAYGDALSRIFELQGHTVTREFYVNDYGSQVRNFAASIRARAQGQEVPEDGYRGDYVKDLTGLDTGQDLDALGIAAVAAMLARTASSLDAFGVHMDTWFSERSLHPDRVQHGFDVLAEQGNTYRSEGALWLRTSAFGDDKDRVLVRSDGQHTYFASDIAYHQEKRERGFDRLIDVWGADHHGYRERMKAAFGALGGDPDRFEMLIMQFVHLADGKMSKRAGEFVTLDELVSEIGVDAARWYLLQRSHDTTIELDLALARLQAAENPVFYVQYAHARLASVIGKAGRPADEAPPVDRTRTEALEPAERVLIKKLLAFPGEVAEAAERRAPHRIATYALELAQDTTAFYRDCRVVGAEDEDLRIAECVAARRTIAAALALLGVSAPASM